MNTRNQTEFKLLFNGVKLVTPLTWSISVGEDAAGTIECAVDAREYPEVSRLVVNAAAAQDGEPLQFKGRLFLSGVPKIDYSLVLAGVRYPYQELVQISAVVKQYTFDRPLALKDTKAVTQATGGKVSGDTGAIVGKVVKPGLFGTQLKKLNRSVVQKPDGTLLIVAQNQGENTIVRTLPLPGDTIKYDFGVAQNDEKSLANQSEVNNSDPTASAVTGGSPAKPIDVKDDDDVIVAKKLYNAVSARYGDVIGRAAVAYHCTECNSYKDARKIQNGGNSSGILQWTVDGCEQIAVLKGNTNRAKYEYLKQNINNVEMQITGLLQFHDLWTKRGAVANYRSKLPLLGGLVPDPLRKEFMVWAGTMYYPGFGVTKENPWDSRIGSNNITLRQVATGKYKMEFALKEMQRLLSK